MQERTMSVEDARLVAYYLTQLGFKQVSNGFSRIARITISDEELKEYLIRDNFGDTTSGVPSLPFESQKDWARRCCDDFRQVIVAPWEVMREMRNLGAVA